MTAREKALEEACRALVEHDDQLRALCAKRTSSWRTVLEWYRAHPADSDVIAAARTALSLPPAPAGRMGEDELEELERMEREDAWAAPWTAHTFEIDCPCPNGEDCGDLHTCDEVEARIRAQDAESALSAARAEAETLRRERDALMVELNRKADEARAFWGERDEARAALATERAARESAERERDEARERTKQWQDFCLRHPEILPPEPAREIGELRARASAAESALRDAREEAKRVTAEWDAARLCYVDTLRQVEAERDAALTELAALRGRAQAVVNEYATDLRAGRWSDVLLAAMDELRAALLPAATTAGAP